MKSGKWLTLALMGASLTTIFVILAFAGYSNDGYSLMRYPGNTGNVVVCIEGEINPENQTVSVLGDSPTPYSSWVTLNSKTVINESSATNITNETDTLRVGCNILEYGSSDENATFKVVLSYKSLYRPKVTFLEAADLKASYPVRYHIAVKDSMNSPVKRSWINITDVTGGRSRPLAHLAFDGPSVTYNMPDPGDYRALVQVSDGHTISDVYSVAFTSHVLATPLQVGAYAIDEVPDDKPIKRGGPFTPLINPNDHELLKGLKRAFNGAYITYKIMADYAGNLARDITAYLYGLLL